MLLGPGRTPSNKRENDDAHRHQRGHARDGDAEINAADDGIFGLGPDLTAAHCASPSRLPCPQITDAGTAISFQ